MEERDAIFRDQLIGLMSSLNGGESANPALRRRVGSFANELVRQGGARSWADLKDRADGATYDSLLRLFQNQSTQFSAQKDSQGVRSCEILAVSLIARRQYQADLLPGMRFLDEFIERCEKQARRQRAGLIAIPRANGK